MAQIGGHSINGFTVIHFLISEEEFRKSPRSDRVEIDSLFSYSPVGEIQSRNQVYNIRFTAICNFLSVRHFAGLLLFRL